MADFIITSAVCKLIPLAVPTHTVSADHKTYVEIYGKQEWMITVMTDDPSWTISGNPEVDALVILNNTYTLGVNGVRTKLSTPTLATYNSSSAIIEPDVKNTWSLVSATPSKEMCSSSRKWTFSIIGRDSGYKYLFDYHYHTYD